MSKEGKTILIELVIIIIALLLRFAFVSGVYKIFCLLLGLTFNFKVAGVLTIISIMIKKQH
jgi:cytochrome c oxidase assembly protein Cox11